MRLAPVIAALACLVAGPGLAAANADPSTSIFVAGAEVCWALIDDGVGEAAAETLVTKAGFIPDDTHSPMLQRHFMPDAVKVQWWRGPASEGKVFIAYDAAGAYCNVFLLDRPPRDVVEWVQANLPLGYEPFQKGSTDYIKLRADGKYQTISIKAEPSTGNLAAQVGVWAR